MLWGEARYEFEKYQLTQSPEDLAGLNKILKSISQKDGFIGAIYRLMDGGMSGEEAVAGYQKTHTPEGGQAAVANLIKTLKGNDLLIRLVDTTDSRHPQRL